MFPAPTNNALYVIFYPDTTIVTRAFGNQVETGCMNFGGYHDSLVLDAAHNSLEIAYAVIPFCTMYGLLTNPTDSLSGSSSHEIIEAVTDPKVATHPAWGAVDLPHRYWGLPSGQELGDLCVNQTAFYTPADVGYVVQRTWSNQAIAKGHDPCVAAPVGLPYFNAVPSLGDTVALPAVGNVKGVHIPAGASRTIDVHLFSDGPTAPFTVSAFELSLFDSVDHLSLSFDDPTGQNGQVLHLTITVQSPSVASAEFFELDSTLPTGEVHSWYGLVGN
jgi:hypothetical protein